jgi:membrane fusion protein, multidrug efflux system
MKRTVITAVVTSIIALGGGLAWWLNPGLLHDITRRVSAAQPADNTKGPAASPQRGKSNRSVVEVAKTQKVSRTREIKAIGSLQSDESVRLAPEIAGSIAEIVLKEGRTVKQGDILIKLDDELVQAEVAQAKARLTLARANNERARTLSRTGNVTERSRDEAVSTFETARAELELAEARLRKHVLRAPFDGVVGLRNASVGTFVPAGTPIVNIEKIDTLKVDFQVPEIYLRDMSTGQAIEVAVDAFPQRLFSGSVYAINPLVDVNGRSLQVRARLANADSELRPGLFARIALKAPSSEDVVVVSESAIVPRGGETFVFRVEDGKAIEERVVLGYRANGEVEIVSGLSDGDTIVVAGQQSLRTGSEVEIAVSRNEQPAGGASRQSSGGSG